MSDDPVRLRDLPDAPAAMRRDLAHAADSPRPPVDLARGLAKLTAAIDAGVGIPATGSLVWHFAIVGLATVALVVVGELHALRPSPHGTARIATTPAVVPTVPPPADTLPLPPLVPAPPPVVEPPAASLHRAHAVPSLATHAPAAPSHGDEDVADMMQMARLRGAMASGPATALGMAEDGLRAFPHGIYTEEREAYSIDALVRLGRLDDARARARSFLARHPHGPLSERVRALTIPH